MPFVCSFFLCVCVYVRVFFFLSLQIFPFFLFPSVRLFSFFLSHPHTLYRFVIHIATTIYFVLIQPYRAHKLHIISVSLSLSLVCMLIFFATLPTLILAVRKARIHSISLNSGIQKQQQKNITITTVITGTSTSISTTNSSSNIAENYSCSFLHMIY